MAASAFPYARNRLKKKEEPDSGPPGQNIIRSRDAFDLMNRYPPFLVLITILVILTMFSGCTFTEGGRFPTVPEQYSDPIVGSWLYYPPDENFVQLYIFKDSGRFDATDLPINPGENLTYELYATGTWNRTYRNHYSLVGVAIYHYFDTDAHSSQKINATLVYNPLSDSMYATDAPGPKFRRISREPVIPPGFNVSLPFD
jgi:hypothetical protein